MLAFTRFLMIVLLISPLVALSQENNEDEAKQDPYEYPLKVREEQGLAWFILSKPVRNFEKLSSFEITYSKKHTDAVHIKQLENIYEYKGRALKKKHPEADGLYSPDGTTVYLIRYTDDVERHHRISNTRTFKNKQAYIWGEPLKINEPAFELKHDGTLQDKQPVLENTMKHWVKKGENEGKQFDAILFKENKVVYLKYLSQEELKEREG